MNSPTPSRPGRTFELKVLVAGLLVISLASWLRLRLAVVNWEVLPEIGVTASPLYLAFSAALWGLACLVAGLGVGFRQHWAPNLTRITSLTCAIWYWAERLALTQSPEAQQNWPFTLGFTLIALVFVFGALALPAQKAFFEG